MPSAPLTVRASIKGFSRIDFEVKNIRKTLREQANPIKKIAQNLVSRKGVSTPNEYAGRQTGLLRRSIKAKVARNGMSAAIAPFRIGRMVGPKDGFYPAFIVYGRKDGTLKPRKNQMAEAFKLRRVQARDAIYNTITSSIKPR